MRAAIAGPTLGGVLFLVESYRAVRPEADPAVDGRLVEAAGAGAVRFVTALAVPHDELVFWVFEAPSQEALAATLAAATIPCNRISEASAFSPGGVTG